MRNIIGTNGGLHYMLKQIIEKFIEKELSGLINDGYIYNEFSLQHELGIYLRKELGENYKVQFERNIVDEVKGEKEEIKQTNPKKWEMDIIIKDKNNDNAKCAIELKFPRNGQYPEQMFSFVKDIYFSEWLKRSGFAETYCVTLVDDDKFYEQPSGASRSNNEIYSYFRNKQIKLPMTIRKPTGKDEQKENIELSKEYSFKWEKIKNADEKFRYYFVSI